MAYELSGNGYRGRFAEAVERDQARAWLALASRLWETCEPLPTAVWKQSIALLPTPLGDAAVKRVSRKKPRVVRNHRALRLFDLALRLGSAGVETAQPWAALLPRGGAGPTLFLAEFLRVPTLRQWIRVGGPGDRASIAREVADVVARLHLRHLRHRDLKSPNLLLDPTEPPRVVVLDLDGVRTRWIGSRVFPRKARARDLARLRLSLMQATRPEVHDEVWPALLARYAERLGDEPAELDALSRGWAEKHLAENEERGRPTV